MAKEQIKDPKIRALCQKVDKKLREFEEDEMQIRGAVTFAYKANDKPVETLNKLYDYLCDPDTIKTRHKINEYILEMDTEFQERVKANILKNAEKLKKRVSGYNEELLKEIKAKKSLYDKYGLNIEE